MSFPSQLFKANKMTKSEAIKKLNKHIIFVSALMLFTKIYQN